MASATRRKLGRGDATEQYTTIKKFKTHYSNSYVIAADVTFSAVTQDASSLGYPSHKTKYSIVPCKIFNFCIICFITVVWHYLMLSHCNYSFYQKKQPSGNWSQLVETASVLQTIMEVELTHDTDVSTSLNVQAVKSWYKAGNRQGSPRSDASSSSINRYKEWSNGYLRRQR